MSHLLHLELDGGAHGVDLALEVVPGVHEGGELTGLGQTGAQQTGDLQHSKNAQEKVWMISRSVCSNVSPTCRASKSRGGESRSNRSDTGLSQLKGYTFKCSPRYLYLHQASNPEGANQKFRWKLLTTKKKHDQQKLQITHTEALREGEGKLNFVSTGDADRGREQKHFCARNWPA